MKTDKGISWIPDKNIKAYLRIYKWLKKIDVKKLVHCYPEDDFNKLFFIARRLRKEQWIDSEAFVDICDHIVRCSLSSDAIVHRLCPGIAIKPRSLGRPKDYALDFLIFALIFDLKYFSQKKRHQYSVVAEFLQYEGLILSSNDVKDRYLRQLVRGVPRPEGVAIFNLINFAATDIHSFCKMSEGITEGFVALSINTVYYLTNHPQAVT